MNNRFICAIHYFELEKKEISISLPSGSISNERKMLEKLLDLWEECRKVNQWG